MAYSAGAGYRAFSDVGAWYATAGVDPQNLAMAVDVVRDEVARLRAEAPSADEVANVIKRIAGAQILADEGDAPRGNRHASRELLGTEPTEEYVRRIREVTPEARDVGSFARPG